MIHPLTLTISATSYNILIYIILLLKEVGSARQRLKVIYTLSVRRPQPRPSITPGLGVCEWSPEVLYHKSVSLIPNIDEILILVKKKIN